MRRSFTKLTSDEKVVVNLKRYLVRWDEVVASKFQFSCKAFLKKYWEHDLVCEELAIPSDGGKGSCRVDIINVSKMIAVEVMGKQHGTWVECWGSRGSWLNQITRDELKRAWCERNGFKFIEIEPGDKLSLAFFRETFGIEII